MATDNAGHGPPPPTAQATDIISPHIHDVHDTEKTAESNARRTPAHKPPIGISSISPLSRLASPLDSSDISLSPSSGGFLSLLGAATSTPLTPLSSLDGGGAWCPSSVGSSAMADDHDRDLENDHNHDKPDAMDVGDDNSKSQDTIFPFGDMPKSAGSEKGEAYSAPHRAVGAVAATTAIVTQSPPPIRATGTAAKKGAPKDTRSKKSTGTAETNTSDNTIDASASDTTIAKPSGAAVDPIRVAADASPPASTIVPPSDANPRCETSTRVPESATATPREPQGPQNLSGPATQRVTPNTRASGDEKVPFQASSALETSNVSRPFAGAVATASFTTKIVQPKAVKPKPSPPPPQQPAIVRTTSSHGNLPLRQPKPDPNGRPVGFAGSVAQLEETAEQLSSTGSIETAIREAHQELKRSDSRRSSILAASLRQASSRTPSRAPSVVDPTETLPRREFSRQSSIIELNSAARSGAFSPNDYIMSPGSSIAGSISRQRSTSKASSTGSAHGSLMASILGITDQSFTGDDPFPFLSRHGPGKSSVRSARSGQLSMPEIAELEPPSALTQDALDEADRRIAAGEDHDDDDTIRASAHQHIDSDDDDDNADHDADVSLQLTPNQETQTQQPALGSSAGTDSALLSSRSPPPIARPSVTDFLGYASPPQYVPNPAGYPEYTPSGHMERVSQHDDATQHHEDNVDNIEPSARDEAHEEYEQERPTTAGSGATYEQAQSAFDDFDGVHCDPEAASIRRSTRSARSSHAQSILERQSPAESPRQTPPMPFKQRLQPPPRPTSYLDPHTGQQMLFYPARVPAMLQLPQKLSRNPKAAERNARRSQVLSMMMQGPDMRPPRQERQSRVFLPDPMEGKNESHFMSGADSLSPDMNSPDLTSNSISPNPLSPALSGDLESGSQSPTRQSLLGIDPALAANADDGPATGSAGEGEENGLNHLRRPSRLIDSDKRKSRMSAMTVSKLPPQLRASAYFDLPSTTANIEVKNGSAMDTLDSILDAAAAAPVSAFTDHAFAGHLGAEVYGAEKKRPKKKAGAAGNNDAAKRPGLSSTQQELPTSKTRGSFMPMMHIRKVSEPIGDGRSEFEVPRVRRRLSNFDGAVLSPGLSEGTDGGMAPGPDERVSDDEEVDREEDEEEEEGSDTDSNDEHLFAEGYYGPPTTLLAELQLRKQQQKLRTRPINKAFPNGMHSTLLELDAVAEIERRTRKAKKVNLAWEDPSMQPLDNDSDDEDVPLGMLYAAKASGQKDISAVVAEMNRPLGLMEKKELEDNEPLSRRRDRLQGRDPGVSMYLGPSFGSNAVKRQSMLTLTPTLAAINNPQAGSQQPGEDADKEGSDDGVEEVEDEPLAARLQRIKAKEESELPRARPVSMAFSEELLGQFVDPEEEAREREKELEKEKAKAQPPAEEEETLGQRRRRLQAEKEARELEMGGSGGGGGLAVNGQALHALTGSDRLSRRLSLANVLSAHPADAARGAQHPRDSERLRREQEVARANFEKDQKMAAMRAQMPRNISNTSLGGGVTKPGGYMGGLLNDGSGGIGALNRTSIMQHHDGPGVGPWAKPGTIGGPMGNASALNFSHSASMGNLAGVSNMQAMNGMNGMAMGGTTYGSGLNTVGMGMNGMNGMNGMAGMNGMGGMGMGMGMNNRTTSYGSFVGMPQQNMMGNNGMAYNGYAGMQMPMQMQMPNMNMNMNMNMNPMMQMQMPMQMQPQQTDRVERWRQGVMP